MNKDYRCPVCGYKIKVTVSKYIECAGNKFIAKIYPPAPGNRCKLCNKLKRYPKSE